jgi:hypothetical protein
MLQSLVFVPALPDSSWVMAVSVFGIGKADDKAAFQLDATQMRHISEEVDAMFMMLSFSFVLIRVMVVTQETPLHKNEKELSRILLPLFAMR